MRENKFLGAVEGTFVIAEIGSNFKMGTIDRDLTMAKKLIDIAAEAGVNAVKFQSFNSDRYYACGSKKPGDLGRDQKNLKDAVKDLELSPDLVPVIAKHCKERKMVFISTPFSVEDFLLINDYVTVHKIASYEINHLPLLKAVAETHKPIILSTGASNIEDIEYAINVLRKYGTNKMCLLQCTASYPAPPNEMNLNCMQRFGKIFSLPFGLSDHSENPYVASIMAVAHGASVVP